MQVRRRIGWKVFPKIVAKEICCRTFTEKHRHHEESGLGGRETDWYGSLARSRSTVVYGESTSTRILRISTKDPPQLDHDDHVQEHPSISSHKHVLNAVIFLVTMDPFNADLDQNLHTYERGIT